MSNGGKYRLLRTDLPLDVWLRLQAEADQKGLTVGKHVKNLIITRDAKRLGQDKP